MKTQILLNNKKSKKSVNLQNNININLNSLTKILPTNDIIDKIDSYNVYMDEMDSSNTYRVIITINPVCTNVLFNAITEIVLNEGSDDTKVLTNTGIWENNIINKQYIPDNVINKSILNRVQAIKDTEYSSSNIDGGYVYHCGWDIFNNHLLRSQTFKAVNKMPNNVSNETTYIFNTLKDYARLNDGSSIQEPSLATPIKNGNINYIDTHLYQLDDIMTFDESCINNIVEENGWFGFTNTSKLLTKTNYPINKCMLKNKACEHIDMYPDRSLYDFSPKRNKFRKRMEYNWDVCLTYPYRSDYLNNELIFDKDNKVNGILIIQNIINGDEIFFKTPIKHNLSKNDKIVLYYYDDKINKINYNFNIRNTGDLNNDNKDYWFSIERNELIDFININNDSEFKEINFRFCKINNGFESRYYFRIFKKIPNLKLSEENILSDNIEVNDDFINKILSKSKNKIFDYSLNKLAFSKNIYSDNISQIVFTDDIILTKLTDNIGRPISEIFLTIIKNNKGNKEWYENMDYNNPDIEFSHCFGKITNGLKLPPYNSDDKFFDEKKYYNIIYNHNIDISKYKMNANKYPSINNFLDYMASNLLTSSSSLNDINFDGIHNEVTIKGDVYDENNSLIENEFIGDLVEFNPVKIEEYVIEPIYYRFNTMQRELIEEDLNTKDDIYSNIYYDDLVSDDYDYITNDLSNVNNFVVKDNLIYNEIIDNDGNKINYSGNIKPEGLIYTPHYKLQLKYFSNNVNQAFSYYLNHISINENYFSVKNIDFIEKNSVIDFYYKNNNDFNFSKKSYTVIKYNFNTNDKLFNVFLNENVDNNIITSDRVLIFRRNPVIPKYGVDLLDGSGRFVWREILQPSKDNDHTYTFTNGSYYIYNNINFFLKRQDPKNEYGLIARDDIFNISGKTKDVSSYNYIVENENEPC